MMSYDVNSETESSQLLLSKLKRERPVCFRPEEFFEENFDVDTFLAYNRKSFTLESLKKDLENYSTTIQNSLVELINRDYADFVNLSTNLVGVDQSILKLEAPLISIHADVDIIRKSIDSEIQLISEKLEQRSDIRSKQEILHGLLSIQQLTDKIERLIDNRNEEGENLFERVASEYSQLQFYVSKNEALPFVQIMAPKIKRISDYLEGGLHKSFKTGLHNKDKNSVTQCLRIFTTLGRVDQSEQLFGEAIISPLVDQLISKEKLAELGLAGVYNSVLDALPAATNVVLALTTPTNDNELRSFDFMSNATFPTIVSKISTKIPNIFAVGDPKLFQKCYRETMEFMRGFEEQCQYKERALTLRQHPSYKNFLARWSLPIYFQIRLQEIAGSFEHQLLSPYTYNTDPGGEYLLPATEMLKLCLCRCWDKHVLLLPLTYRFYKLSLQLISRYAAWLSEIPTSSEELLLSDICKAVKDAQHLTEQLPDLMRELAGETVPGARAVAGETVPGARAVAGETVPGYSDTAVKMCSEQLLAAIPVLAEHVCTEVIEESSKVLEHAQAVPRLYRRTNRELPTEPLSYVSQLTDLLEREIYQSVLPDTYKTQWCRRTANQLIVRYHDTVSEVLVSLRKTEDSLAMLKRGRKSTQALAQSSSSGVVTDEDKIRKQLNIDVQHLGQKLEQMGIEKGEEFQKLSDLVTKK